MNEKREGASLGLFEREDGRDNSVLTCVCGGKFRWSGFSGGLVSWVNAHAPHMEKRKDAAAERAVAALLAMPIDYGGALSGSASARALLAHKVSAEYAPLVEAARKACRQCRNNHECGPHEELEAALARIES